MNYSDFTSEQLMLWVAKGDEAALECLYDRYSPSVMGVVYKVVKDRGVAEEIVQETFWRVWSHAASYQEQRGTFTSWLFSIAHRLAIDTWRQQKVRPQLLENEAETDTFETYADPKSNVPEMVDLEIQRKQIQGAVATLSSEQQKVIRLAYFYGLTRQEIAAFTGDPLGTVHTRARLALQKLHKFLVAEGVEA